MSYKINPNGGVILDGMIIPENEGNRDYRAYLEWVAQGNTPEPADPPSTDVVLTPSQQIILADGIDIATVTIAGAPNAQVEFTVNGALQSIQLDANGRETIELLSDTPSTILLVQAGTARAVVYAVEVPA